MPEQKTPEQLEREIAYFRQELERTISTDRQQRCRTAIRTRERQLNDVQRPTDQTVKK